MGMNIDRTHYSPLMPERPIREDQLTEEDLAALPTGTELALHHRQGTCVRVQLVSVDRETGRFSSTWPNYPAASGIAHYMTDYCLRKYPDGWNPTNWVSLAGPLDGGKAMG